MAQPVSALAEHDQRELLHSLGAYGLPGPLALFALGGWGTNNQVLGLRCGAGEFVVKRYRAPVDHAALLYEHAVLDYLAAARLSVRVPAPVAALSGATLVCDGESLLALFTLLPGRQERAAPALAEQAGAALAEIHLALANFTHTLAAPLYAENYVESLRPASDAAALPITQQQADWWLAELAEVREFAAGPYRSLPRQVIHGDFLLNNTLFLDGRLTAVLDFEAAGVDVRALDLASALYFTLRAWEETPLWDCAAALCRGYGRHSALSDQEILALPSLIRLRNGRSLVRRFERQPEQAAWRLERTQIATAWLIEQQLALTTMVAEELGRPTRTH